MPKPSARIVNTVIVLLLLIAAGLLLPLQTGPLPVPDFSADRLVIAGVCLAIYLVACVLLLRRRRGSKTVSGDEGILVLHASQTGLAQELAERSAALLQQAGRATQLAALGAADPSWLKMSDPVLFVVSTTGEGDAPDTAYRFVHQLLNRPADLSRLRYGLLALGDRRYAEFCGFGRRLDQWLQRNGATPLFEAVEVDDGDGAALHRWQLNLGDLGASVAAQDWALPQYRHWTLVERRLGNPGSAGDPMFHLSLQPPANVLPAWQAGDIAEIAIENDVLAVQTLLDARGLNGAQSIEVDGLKQTLQQMLMRRNLDSLPENFSPGDGLNLPLLPHREYSIASVPADGHVDLLLRQRRLADGRLSLASAWLTQQVPIGGGVALRLRSNPNFHAPSADQPMLLIGNGTGIAGLRSHLKARVAAGARRNWLLFGERNAAHDQPYGEDLDAWRANGYLQRLDRVYSRDQAERLYVQHRLSESIDELRRWLADGAYVYLCGSVEGMARGIDEVLREALGELGYEDFAASGRYRRDVY